MRVFLFFFGTSGGPFLFGFLSFFLGVNRKEILQSFPCTVRWSTLTFRALKIVDSLTICLLLRAYRLFGKLERRGTNFELYKQKLNTEKSTIWYKFGLKYRISSGKIRQFTWMYSSTNDLSKHLQKV